MKAMMHSEFGPPDILRLTDVAKPTPAAGEILVRVRAASLNAADWHILRGEPRVMRLFGKPNGRIPGLDFAGEVEQVGASVAEVRAGDEVFGAGKRGALAEYVCVPESVVARKPAGVTFEQAAALPVAGVTALGALRDRGRLRAGERVLIIGAAGGVGTLAVQIAKALGAHVTGVCSTSNLGLVRSLGADHAVDYTAEDCTRTDRPYDLILHVAGNRSLPDLRRALTPDGTLVFVGSGTGRENAPSVLGMLRLIFRSAVLSRFTRQRVLILLGTVRKSDLTFLAELAAAGKLTPAIDRTYPLAEAAEAFRYLETGHVRGKVIVLPTAAG
ncbi:MAG TPA: NAD(P)-dependent alcohol dehydrogenase [Gammaproteobacteria bacterium]|nr:NAD(P)-dependent alcohol dehydrogenase [Gammaproteobacteria bacterium]